MTLDRYLSIITKPAAKPRAKRRDVEGPIQTSIIQMIEAVAPYCYVAALPNGEYRNKITAARLKKRGVKRGLPDLMLILSTGQVAFIEVKSPGGTMSPEQKAFRDMADQRAIHFACVDSAEPVANLLRMWGEQVR